MRFVKVNTAEFKSKICNRQSIAKAAANITARVDRCTGITEKINFKEKYTKIKKFIINRFNKKTVAAAAVAVSALGLVIVFNANFSFAYDAYMGGTHLGIVPSKAYIEKCVDNINTEFAQYVSGEDMILSKATYVPAVIRKGSFTDDFTLCENIKSTSDVMVSSYAVEVDGVAFTALEAEDNAYDVLEQIKSLYKTDENSIVSFKEKVSVVKKYVPSVIVADINGAISRLCGVTTVYNNVTVDSDISFNDFAYANGFEVDYLRSLNQNAGDVIKTGDTIVVPAWDSVLTVLTTDMVKYDSTVPFDEQVVEDATVYEGHEKILQAGANGTNAIVEKIEKENGEVVNQTVVSCSIIADPVMQMRAIGTMERPAHVGSGSFLRPYYGQISSRFGSRRSGNHTGVDICGSVGDPIIAADNGTVSFAGWGGGYGKLIKIDHNNGYVTYYAHCNELYVSEGDVVKKGETIAALGNTGNSTGPHIHFEVRYNDQILNPMNYVN